jgi:hypothetical protein
MASIIPVGIIPIPFQGQSGPLYRSPVGLVSPIDGAMGGNSVRIDIDWASDPYLASTLNPTVAVSVNLLGQAVQTPLDQIRSVYIDNSNSITPIYILFPDTNFLIQCPPRSVAWQPVLTGQQKAIIMGVGFEDNLVPVTPVHFSNIPVAGYCIPIIGSNLVRGRFNGVGGQVATTQNFGPLALGAGMPIAPDRIAVVGLAIQLTGAGFPNITACTISGETASIISQGANAGSGGLFYFSALVYAPIGITGGGNPSISLSLSAQGTRMLIGSWAIFNASDPDPISSDNRQIGNSEGLGTVSPFVTQDGFCCAIAASRVAGTPDVSWFNADEAGQFANDTTLISLASVNGGADNYVAIGASPVGQVRAATWN